jgi:hypothetical protein
MRILALDVATRTGFAIGKAGRRLRVGAVRLRQPHDELWVDSVNLVNGLQRVDCRCSCSTQGRAMTAEILPFPSSRRRTFVARHAAHIALLAPEAGERYLTRQMQIQAETMSRRGIAAERITAEISALKASIRAKLVHLLLAPGGAA